MAVGTALAPSAFIHNLESIRGNDVLRSGLLDAHSRQEAMESGLPFSRFISCPLSLCSATATLCLWLEQCQKGLAGFPKPALRTSRKKSEQESGVAGAGVAFAGRPRAITRRPQHHLARSR